ncbi:hypothetical protein GCM10010251_93360 [Streptomyces aurantiogriseus]|uniref:Uncharacterized protein n=1 Tax=Streptomyces aurantiogriseus TaxID=66870 RepID=A0A918FP97_9ACTN|nr:hypothetical protein GCM10010251_93360 [Streptomyces aurantiogriseus]
MEGAAHRQPAGAGGDAVGEEDDEHRGAEDEPEDGAAGVSVSASQSIRRVRAPKPSAWATADRAWDRQ